MQDDIDEGLNIRALGTPSPQFKSKISFGDIRHYSNTGAVMIGIWRQVESTNNPGKMGLINTSTDVLNANFLITTASASTNIVTDDGVTTSSSAGNPYDRFSFQLFKIELTPTVASLVFNGILETSKTTNLPQLRLEPTFQCNSTASGVQRDMRVRYGEAFNT